MSDYKLPDLPSDEDLGLTAEEIKELESEFSDGGPEMTAGEMAALLGEAPRGKPPAVAAKAPQAKDGAAQPSKKDQRATERARKKAEKEAAKAERVRKKAESEAAKAARSRAKQDKASAKAAREKAKQEKKASSAQSKAEKAVSPDTATSAKEGTDESKNAPPTPIEEGPRSKWRGPATAALLLAACIFASSRTGQLQPVPANAGEAEFSSARAMGTLVEIARAAHPTGSPEHARVRAYLVDRLTALGLEPEIQTTTSLVQFGPVVQSATVRNVVARITGTASTGAVLVTAHYDSRELALGAADDGSGVVTILEAVRAIQAGEPLQNDIILLLSDAEELGLLGARAFVDEHPWMDDVRLALSFEMRGGGGPSIMFETGEQNGWIVRAFRAADPTAYGNSMSYEVYRRLPRDTDYTPFKEAGIQGLNFAGIDNAHVYHQVYDSPENMSESTLQHHGAHLLNALLYLGSQDLVEVDAPNVTFFNVPGFGFFVYDAKWILPISGGLLVLFALALLVTRGVTGGFVGIVVGAGLSTLGIALSYGATTVLADWLPAFHPELGSLHGSAYHSEGWYVLTLVCVALAIVTALHGIARRWVHLNSLALGATIAPLGAAAWLSYSMPLAAMNFQWPLAAALSSIVLLGILRRNAPGVVGWILALLLALPVVAFLAPVTELLWIAMSFQLAGPLAVLMAATAYLCLPALDGLRHPNSWWAPVTGLVVGCAALGIGILTARATTQRPSPSTLVYALDHGAREALWVTAPLSDSTDMAAREWAVARAGSEFGALRDLSKFAYTSFAGTFGEVPVTDAEFVDAAEPEIRTDYSEPVGGKRQVLMSVRSLIGAEAMAFQYAEGSGTRLLSINGKAVPDPSAMRWAFHAGEPNPVVLLELEVPENETLELSIVEHTFRPQEILGAGVFERPAALAPDITRLSDRAMLLTRFAARGVDEDNAAPFGLQQLLDSMTVGNEGRDEVSPGVGGADAVGLEGDAGGVEVVADTTEVVADTTEVVADTTGVAVDTTGAATATTPADPDTSSVQVDTTTGRADTTGAVAVAVGRGPGRRL